MKSSNPYRAAGAYNGISYVEREADIQLRLAIERNQRYPYFLAPRQIGKSSLIQHTISVLDSNRYRCIFVDLSTFPEKTFGDYDVFLRHITKICLSDFQIRLSKRSKTVYSNFSKALEEILQFCQERVIIFIDEVDVLASVDFKDSFLSLIRSMFNERAWKPELERLQFILSGTIEQTKLISDSLRSPFNVGVSIKLNDLTLEQTHEMTLHLQVKEESMLWKITHAVYVYTSGSVYLTQLVLEKLWDQYDSDFKRKFSLDSIDSIVDAIFVESSNNVHFTNIYRAIAENPELQRSFLNAIQEKPITKPEGEALQLIGIVGTTFSYRNDIYRRVFGIDGPLELPPRAKAVPHHTIFLAYARQDTILIQALANDLRALGGTVWLDEEVSGGQAWWDHILEQIRACDVFVFALSPAALESLACRRESAYAAALGKSILPILLTGDEPRHRLSSDLAKIQYVDYREQTRGTSLRLARALSTMPSTPPLPEPLPEPPDVPLSYLNQLAAQINGEAPLNFEAQSVLVIQLKRSLTNSETAQDARALIGQLRRRRDLLAQVADEMDEALGTTPAWLETKLTALQQERDALQQRASERQRKVVELEVALTEEKAARQKEREEFQRRESELQIKLEAEAQQITSDSPKSDLTEWYTNSIGMAFVLIPAGTFQMGSNDGYDNEKPVHRVIISRPFYLGIYKVTQAQWEAVMGSNPSEFTGDPNLPVTNVSWHDIQEFIEKLNDGEMGHTYRLPTEAEWEYAARAGTITAYSFGDDPGWLDQYGWYDGNSARKPHAVGQLKANPWGLYDIHGNVWEWVQDWYGVTYPSDHQADPKGPKKGSRRVVRGGSFDFPSVALRTAFRSGDLPEGRAWDIGFRCACVPVSVLNH